MYTALYRTYRPEVFSEIIGQEHIVKILKNQLRSDTVSHAYLLCGTRGTGKTTTARILAKGVNCTAEGERPCGTCDNCRAIATGVFLDVIEIDAASNNGVDNIRELRESVKYPPAVGRKKVYIIDEVHMLSTGAFNALLKTLEEPPESVMFILATTDPQKLPATILSRCMRLDFKRVPEALLRDGMAAICEKVGASVSGGALKLIAVNADGSMRDGLSILDQCLAGGEKQVEREDVLSYLGASGEEVFLELTDFVKAGNIEGALLLLARQLEQGRDARQFMKDWLSHYRGLLIAKYLQDAEDVLNMSCENIERVRNQSKGMALAQVSEGIVEISKTVSEARWSTQPRILLELCIVKLANPEGFTPNLKPATSNPKPAISNLRPEPATSNLAPDLWASLFQGEDALAGSLTMLRGDVSILSMNDDGCTLQMQKEFVKGIVEKNKERIENLMEKRSGKRRIITCVLTEGSAVAPEKTVESLAAELGDLLGLDVEIEE